MFSSRMHSALKIPSKLCGSILFKKVGYMYTDLSVAGNLVTYALICDLTEIELLMDQYSDQSLVLNV